MSISDQHVPSLVAIATNIDNFGDIELHSTIACDNAARVEGKAALYTDATRLEAEGTAGLEPEGAVHR